MQTLHVYITLRSNELIRNRPADVTVHKSFAINDTIPIVPNVELILEDNVYVKADSVIYNIATNSCELRMNRDMYGNPTEEAERYRQRGWEL